MCKLKFVIILMKKTIYILFVSLLFLSSCKKEAKTVSVTYKIIVTGGNPTYTASYTLADGTTKTQGKITQSKWLSDNIKEVETGKYISLSVEGSGGGFYELFIYINGILNSHREAGDGYGTQTLNTQVTD